MVHSAKGLKSEAEEQFEQSLEALRQKLAVLEEACRSDEIMRDAVTVTLQTYYRQLLAMERACRLKEQGGSARDA